MFFSKNPRSILSEAATADMLNPEVSEEVKDTIDELEDTLTNNVEEVKDSDKTTNGGIPVTTEGVAVLESAYSDSRGRKQYYVRLEDVIAIKEAEGEEEAKADMEEPGEAPSEEQVEEHEPDASDVIEKIADANGVDEDQVTVVISSESVSMLCDAALLEAKAGRCGKKARHTKKLKKTKEAIDELKDGKIKLAKA